MRKIVPFDPSAVFSGSFGTNQASAGGWLYLLNESSYGLDLTLGALGTVILPAWYALLIPLSIPLPSIDWNQDYILISTSSPQSKVYGYSFDHTEDVSGYVSGPLVRQANVGNAVQVSGTASLSGANVSGNVSVSGTQTNASNITIPNNTAYQTYDNTGALIQLIKMDSSNNTILTCGSGSGNLILQDTSGNATLNIFGTSITIGGNVTNLSMPTNFTLNWNNIPLLAPTASDMNYNLPSGSGIHAFFDNAGNRLAHIDTSGFIYCKNVIINSSSPGVTLQTGSSIAWYNHQQHLVELLELDLTSNNLCLRGGDVGQGLYLQDSAGTTFAKLSSSVLDFSPANAPLLLGNNAALAFQNNGYSAALLYTDTSNNLLIQYGGAIQFESLSGNVYLSLTSSALDLTSGKLNMLLAENASIQWNTVSAGLQPVLWYDASDQLHFRTQMDTVHGGFLFEDATGSPALILNDDFLDISVNFLNMQFANASGIWFYDNATVAHETLSVNSSNTTVFQDAGGGFQFWNAVSAVALSIDQTYVDLTQDNYILILANNVMQQWLKSDNTTHANVIGLDSSNNILLRMTDAAGANKISFQNSTPSEVAKLDSNGNLTVNSITTTGGGNTASFNAVTITGSGIAALNVNTGGITTTTGVKWTNSGGSTQTIARMRVGTGSFAASTTAVITHNLGATPGNVIACWKDNSGGGNSIGVGTVGSTTFTVFASASNSNNFYWVAMA